MPRAIESSLGAGLIPCLHLAVIAWDHSRPAMVVSRSSNREWRLAWLLKLPPVTTYARMWPREVFDRLVVSNGKKRTLAKTLDILTKPGVYILYRDGVPYYIGSLTERVVDSGNMLGTLRVATTTSGTSFHSLLSKTKTSETK